MIVPLFCWGERDRALLRLTGCNFERERRFEEASWEVKAVLFEVPVALPGLGYSALTKRVDLTAEEIRRLPE